MKVRHFIFTLFLLLGAIGSSIAALSSAQVPAMQEQMQMHADCCEASDAMNCLNCDNSALCDHNCTSAHCSVSVAVYVAADELIVSATDADYLFENTHAVIQRFYPPLTPPPLA